MAEAEIRARLLAAACDVAVAAQRHAPGQDAGTEDISADVAALARTGLLAAPLPVAAGGAGLAHDPAAPAAAIGILVRLGRANLSLARLYEGHLNAVKLFILYAAPAQFQDFAEAVRAGGMYGVWGADAGAPARLERGPRGLHLRGRKRYCSGLGLLRGAVVPVRDPADRQQLILLAPGGDGRAVPQAWQMQGMRATRSGEYDLDGLAVSSKALLGPPDAYGREPWFRGGIWRCAAAQLGALERLVDEMRLHLAGRQRLQDPIQLARVGQAMMAARTARYWVEDAAERVERFAPQSDLEKAECAEAVAVAGMARLQVETSALEAIALAQRAIGLDAFAAGSPLELLVRDLSVYLRQAAPDALLRDCAAVLAGRETAG